MKKLLSLSATLLFISACGNQSTISDDWEGAAPLTFSGEGRSAFHLSDEDVFDFDSTLSLPHVNPGDQFEITTICKRNLDEDSKKQKLYSKKIYSESMDENQNYISVLDTLPEETIIFPEYFSSCDFQINYTTKIGSTDSNSLKDQRLDLKNHTRGITVSSPRNMNITQKNISALNIDAHSSEFSQVKLFCFSNKLSTHLIENSGLASFRGELLTFPLQVPNFPIEYCALTGKNFEKKKIISNRFRVFNREKIGKIHVEYRNPESLNARKTYHGGQPKLLNIMYLKLENRTSDQQTFEFESGNTASSLYVATSLRMVRNTSSKTAYSFKEFKMNLKTVSAQYFWRIPRIGSFQKLSLNPGESVDLLLMFRSHFSCTSQSQSEHPELGFIIALNKQNPLLQMTYSNSNEFITDNYLKGNIFDLYPNLMFTNNLPAGHSTRISRHTSFQIFFRNQNSYEGSPLELTHTTSWSTFNFLSRQPPNSTSLQAEQIRYRRSYFFKQPEIFCSNK